MEDTVLLRDSSLCRLCGEENKNGTNVFPLEENKQDLSQLVNKYLPLKIANDGKYPCTICPGCNIQLEATKLFFDLIAEGQAKLREFFSRQQETIKRQEKQRQQLQNALKNVNPSSSVETYTIQSDETGEKFLIQILSDGPLFPPEHELTLKVEGLERPRRKRGRPPKPPPLSTTETKETETEEFVDKQDHEEEQEFDADGRRKRKIKVPTRYQEVLQGKEMDRIFKEEGVIDEDSLSEEEMPNDDENSLQDTNEVIGHMQSKDGEDLGELVVVNKNSNKIKVKPKNCLGVPIKKKRKYECEICGRIFLHLGRLEVHRSFHKNIKYHCNNGNCLLQTDNKSAMEEHQKETGHTGTTLVESLDYGQIQLPQFEAVDGKNSDLDLNDEDIDNEEVESNESKLKDPKSDIKIICKICEKTFSCKQNYEVHLKAVHENQKPYQCDKCDKKFPYLNSLKCHMLQHSDKIYPCDSCDKVFNHPSSLVYHREAEHNNGRRFVCNKCKKTFKHKQLLLRHQLVHSNDRPHVCKYCEASFKTRANLLNHMPMHTGEKKYYCTMCGQSFAHKTSLTLHIRWHNGQKPYECDVCMKTFSQKGNLAEHKRIHTGEKPYCCDHCGRKFTTSSQYKLHVKRHTGERPWQCEYCSKTFLHKDTWKCHTRRHRNERPYQCSQCMRRFTEQWALKKHERLHTGEKPYICEICSKCFADSSNLTKHKKIHLNGRLPQKENQIVSAHGSIKVLSSSDEGEKILYLAYDECNSNEEEPQTLVHIMDNIDSADASTSVQSNNLDSPEYVDTENISIGADIGLEPSLQQVIDNEGNPISITLADGQQIKVVMRIENETQSIQGLLSDGTLVPINLTMHDGKPVSAELIPLVQKEEKNDLSEEVDTASVDDSQETPEDSVEHLLDNNIHFLNEDGQKLENNIQFLTEDGQNVCFVTTYNMEDTISQQYLTMS